MKIILLISILIISFFSIEVYAIDTVDVYPSARDYLEFKDLYYGKYVENDSTPVLLNLSTKYESI